MHSVFIIGTVLDYLVATDDDDLKVTFAIQGQIGNSILVLNQIEDMKAEIILNSKLDYQVRGSLINYKFNRIFIPRRERGI